jgi:NTP pyrophosphatase (non-canonical NTP hydrolase)
MEKLKAIIRHYGLSAQTSKAVEELIELSEVLIKDMNKGDLDRNGLYEEMADALIMIGQLKIIYNIDTAALQQVIDMKIDRTLERMDDHQI